MPTNDTSSRADPEPASAATGEVLPYPMLPGEGFLDYFNRLNDRQTREQVPDLPTAPPSLALPPPAVLETKSVDPRSFTKGPSQKDGDIGNSAPPPPPPSKPLRFRFVQDSGQSKSTRKGGGVTKSRLSQPAAGAALAVSSDFKRMKARGMVFEAIARGDLDALAEHRTLRGDAPPTKAEIFEAIANGDPDAIAKKVDYDIALRRGDRQLNTRSRDDGRGRD